MIKKFFCAILACFMILNCTACGGAESVPTSVPASAAAPDTSTSPFSASEQLELDKAKELAREVLVQWAAGNERLTKQQKRSAEQITSARLMVGIMLTVGKLAELPKKERRAYGAQIQTCRQELKRCLQEKNGLELLDRGYRIKVRAFGTAPGLYLGLYGLMRRIKKS